MPSPPTMKRKAGRLIQYLMAHKRLNMSQIAKHVGVSWRTVAYWSKNERIPTHRNYQKLFEMREMTREEILK